MPLPALLLCVVIGISDGDTLKVRCDDSANYTLRLRGIDAPEKAQAFGQRSRQHLALLCFGRLAQVRGQARDRYGRLLARVRCGEHDAAEAQLAAGMAWVYRRYSKEAALLRLEREARGRQRGLWADAGAVPPWDWRRSRRMAAQERRPSPV